MTPIVPTAEQRTIVESVRRGDSLRVLAFAGTGKTTTLELAARELSNRRVLYLVFNRAQATVAKQRFAALPYVTAVTAHSLAYREHGHRFSQRIVSSDFAAINAWTALMQERGAFRDFETSDHLRIGRAIVQTVLRFLASADRRIETTIVPSDEGTDPELIAHLARRLWRSIETDDALPVTHDCYLKSWQLRDPRLHGADVVLYDEAQDATPAMLAIVEQQSQMQRVYCGDTHQQLYEFRGATNALDSIHLPALPLTQTRRFGKELARVANALLEAKGEPLRIVGLAEDPGKAPRGYPPAADVYLARTNLGLVERALSIVDSGASFFIRGATDRTSGQAGNGAGELMSQILSAYDLWQGNKSRVESFAMFDSWDDLKEASGKDGGERLAPFVRMVGQYGNRIPMVVARIRDRSVSSEAEADVVLSTVHRFKGEEANVVALADDFRAFVSGTQSEKRPLDETEANIAYVACTRARSELWFGGAYDVLKKSTELRGVSLPTPGFPTAITVDARRSVPSAPPARAKTVSVAPKESFRDLRPGMRREYPGYGVVTIEEATAQLITIVTAGGERKQLGTLVAYPKFMTISAEDEQPNRG